MYFFKSATQSSVSCLSLILAELPFPVITRHRPRVYKPHPASIACTRPAVAGCTWKEVLEVALNCSGVTYWHNWKVSPRYYQWERRALYYGLACIQSEIQPWLIATILVYKESNIIYIIGIITITDIMHIITIFWIVVCFQRRHKGTIEGLGSSVCHSRGWEQKQHTSISDSFRWYNKSSIVDSWRPNHDEVHSLTTVKRFCRKQVAVYPLHTLVLGVSKHQTIVLCWFLHLQYLKKGIYLTK